LAFSVKSAQVPRGKWLCCRVDFVPQLVADQQKYHRIHGFSYTKVIKMLSTLVYILVCVFSHHACQNWLWILCQICPFCQLEGLVNKSQNHHCQIVLPSPVCCNLFLNTQMPSGMDLSHRSHTTVWHPETGSITVTSLIAPFSKGKVTGDVTGSTGGGIGNCLKIL